MCSICLLLEQTNPSHHLFHLISLARQLIEREWTVKLSHTYKEDNFAADHLASLLHSLPVGSHLCNNPSFTCKTLLYRDMTGSHGLVQFYAKGLEPSFIKKRKSYVK